MKRVYELKNQRSLVIAEAEKALNNKDMNSYQSKMEEIKNINEEIKALEELNAEKGRFATDNSHMLNVAAAMAKQKQDEEVMNRLDSVRKGNEYVQAFAEALKTGASIKSGASNEKLKPLYNALTIGGGEPTGSDGGFLVPVEFDDMIHRKKKEFIQLADYFNVENVTGYSGWRAVETTASRKPLPQVGENTAIGKNEQPSFVKVEYTIKKYGDRIAVSQELLDDNTAGLLQYIADWFAPRVVMTENSLLLALLDGLTAKNFTAGKEFAELKSLLNKGLNTAISKNAVLLCNGNSYDFFDQLTDTNGRGLLVPDPTNSDVYRIKNRPIVMADADLIPSRTVTTSGATKGDYDPVYVGDFRAFGTLFRRKALEFKTTDVGGDAWVNDAPEIRGIVRMDAQKVDEAAAVKREIFTAATA